MSRTLEALKQAAAREAPGRPEPAVEAPAFPPQPSSDGQHVEDIPFFEVGAPGPAGRTAPPAPDGPAPIGVRPVPRPATEDRPQCIPLPPAGPTQAGGPAAITFQPLPDITASPVPAGQRFAPELIAFHDPGHPVSDQYRATLAGVLAQETLGGSSVLLLAAGVSGAGATTVLLNLAITAARQDGRRVAVVDANLRRPALAERLGLPAAPGLREVHAGRFPLGRALRETGQANLLVLTAGEAGTATDPSPAGASGRAVLQQLRRSFDLVLVDGPAWDAGPDAVGLAPACDAVYLVLRPGEFQAAGVRDLMRLLPHVGAHLGGYVLTRR
jgi:Mrp family chromosome partitioning ATPase